MPTIISGDGTITGLTTTGISAVQQLPAGSVIQVVSTTINTTTTTSSNSFVSTGLTASITPKFSNSKILITSTTTVGMATQNVGEFAFARNGTIINGGGQGWGGSYLITSAFGTNFGYPWSETYLDSPATISAITYAVYFCCDAVGPVAFCGRGAGNGALATLTLMEIAQ